MRILIIKTSSMGDIIHALPAITDLHQHVKGVELDWVVEKSFSEIPSWHPGVERIIPVCWRHWRKNISKKATWNEMISFLKVLRLQKYDLIIDLQGLLKSALLGVLAKGTRSGFDWKSAREGWASLFYQKKGKADWSSHAIFRMRSLMAQLLNYTPDFGSMDYGLVTQDKMPKKQVLFIHGTTRQDKEWPVKNWIELAFYLKEKGYQVLMPWGNLLEKERAESIEKASGAILLPKSNLTELKNILTQTATCVAVDTGLGHLAAALNVPTVSLYLSTDPEKIGALGKNQIHCKREDGEISPSKVISLLHSLLHQ